MNQYLSPLRYPGGKARLGPFFARLLANQSVGIDTYCEPFAGGAGAALYLVANDHVERVIINDLNPGIAAFWRASLNSSEAFIHLIETCEVSIDAWREQRAVYEAGDRGDDVALGFATFFLNRCNRSGILGARPIGGLEQDGTWKIDARFNRAALASRIDAMSQYAKRIDIREEPATSLLTTINRRTRPVLLYVDPPYIDKGDDLYLKVHGWDDHERLARQLAASPHPWVLTYGVDEEVRELYPEFRCLQFAISHTAQRQKVGSELMFFGRGIRVPDRRVVGDREGAWVG